ncbi:YqjF family protein [Bacillus sp. FJAT-27225]|uniref:YqjF family protein n=1 Tax=Bacillus sp. FJAT-27225 TaxID=1743144 RepID=UPI0015860DB5|nr:DUF2071 domain-containing protein [Bacillus sp. FJAT-27225]
MEDIVKVTAHRPYPLPDLPWMMTQTWENLLFLHWPIPADQLRAHVPEQLELDTWEGQAWLTISPFQVKHQRFRILPEIPLLNEYLELNVRTYVKHGGKGGVYFFSLDANLAPAVLAANGLLALPYKNADMEFKQAEDAFIFTNKRLSAEDGFGEFKAIYKPETEPALCGPGSLEHWLVERYCLFTTRNGKVLRGDIHHLPWDVSTASADVGVNTMSPVPLNGAPIIQFCKSKKVLMFPFVEEEM